MIMAKKYVNSNLYFTVRAKKMLVAALNIGTAFSACAFSFQVDFEKDPMFIVISRALKSINVPTVVLLDKSKKFLSFGYDAEEQYLKIALDEEHHDYYYFCDFKMLLNALQVCFYLILSSRFNFDFYIFGYQRRFHEH